MTDIAIEQLDFDYDVRETGLYRNLSVQFEQGGIIGLVGESGAGKSTLMKLIMRWYDWQQGQIRLSGLDSRQVDKAHLQGLLPMYHRCHKSSARPFGKILSWVVRIYRMKPSWTWQKNAI